MCLRNSVKDVWKLLRRRSSVITCWKVLRVETDYRDWGKGNPRKKLDSLCFIHKWKPGVNKSSSRRRLIPKDGVEVGAGFHVYRSKRRAEMEASYSYYNTSLRVVPVRCNVEDLIAANKSVAVYRKVTLSEAAYKKAMA